MSHRDELYLARTTNPAQPQPQPTSGKTQSHDREPQSIWRRIRGDALLFGGGNVGIMAAQLGFRAILIATLVPAEYGRLTLILTIYNTIWIIGASGVPSSVARYIALISPAPDSSIIRSATKAAAIPTIVAATSVAIIAGIILSSPAASLFAVGGLVSLVYSLLTVGILRGRGSMGLAVLVMLVAAAGEVVPLAILWRSGVGVTPLSAFGVFCAGNVIGLFTGVFLTIRTRPRGTSTKEIAAPKTPSPRELLGFSMWLGAATIGVALLPLVVRSAAAFQSYTAVAVIDVAILLLSLPQRVGAVILMAVVPHAARSLDKGDVTLTISRREHAFIVLPFILAAGVVAFTPIVRAFFDTVGHPVYAKSGVYLALALLAGPARILYGLVEGVLIAHGEGRFLAVNAGVITIVAAGLIFTASALGHTVIAFVVFVAAFWLIYIVAFSRTGQLANMRTRSFAQK
jgi:O-antigen/teichoic acid export membrane protein